MADVSSTNMDGSPTICVAVAPTMASVKRRPSSPPDWNNEVTNAIVPVVSMNVPEASRNPVVMMGSSYWNDPAPREHPGMEMQAHEKVPAA